MSDRILNIEDVESGINIFGNEFDITFSEEYIKRLKEIDISNIKEENVFEKLREMINLVLNDKEAYNKIKKSYEDSKKKEFGIQAFLKVFEFVFEEYSKEMENISKNTKKFTNNMRGRQNYRYNNYNNRGYRRR